MHVRSVAHSPSFLARFAIVLFFSAALAAVLLAFALETVHRRSVESDETLDALSRVEQVLTPVVDRYSRGRALAADVATAAQAGEVFGYVTEVRVYDDRGRPIVPAGAPPDAAAVTQALHAEDWFSVDRGTMRIAYAPLTTTDGRHTYVVAVVLSRGQMGARVNSEGWIVAATTGGAILIVFVSLLALAIEASRELHRRRREAQATFVEGLATFARLLDLRDPYTAGHSERVAVYSRALAAEMRLPAAQVDVIADAALLHDLGKIAVPDAILFKPARLTDEERGAMELHPTVGAEILSGIGTLEEVVPCVLHHHEHVDGSGYPQGLRTDEIPLGARIIAVADAFDAMTTDRPYRRARTAEEAVQELHRCVGSQFDAACVTAFAALAARGAVVPPPSRDEPAFGRKIELQQPSG